MEINWETVLIAVVPSIVTWFVAKTNTRGSIQSKEVEIQPDREKNEVTEKQLYMEQIQLILKDNQAQKEFMQEEMDKLRSQFNDLKKEFDAFKESHDVEIEGYKNTIIQKNERIEDLKMEILELVDENEKLKEWIAHGKPIE